MEYKEEALKPYELMGAFQMFKATGRQEYMEFVLSAVKGLENKTRSLPGPDALAYFLALKQAGSQEYRQKLDDLIEQENWTLEFMPIVTAYDTAYRKKEHYNEIAARFKKKEEFTGSELVALIETIGQMSEEIYEYYRELKDLFKSVVRERLKNLPDSSESLETGYCVLRACNLGVLQREKYSGFGELLWNTMADQDKNRCAGLKEMIEAQYIILRKQEV